MNKIICIVGPTGVGKTALSLALAKQFNTEIINGDAFQVYQEMNILNAKPTKEERRIVKHHLVDYLKISDSLDIASFKEEATKIINSLFKDNKIPIIVGGSGLYLKSLLYDYQLNDLKGRNKDKLKKYDNYTNEEIFKLLEEVDLDASKKLHPNNRKRVLRALEIFDENNIKKSDFINKQNHQPLYDILFIGLTMERELLYQCINNRVDKMVNNGLIDEVTTLYHKYNNCNYQALQAIGYKEFIPYFNNEINLEDAIDKVKQNSRRYAKKQYTWFNNQMEVKWINVDINDFKKCINEAISLVRGFINE
ncbi:MAG: tRNA (adenosine(37)-N6)-dimethylallyltransferase MiaA [Bacilli bacterium]|jgi:tRNA dimethylallyltransferase|nr:tRNA (adenosine(37)-N6)-dimethylallyltransferase MiaA [Bacilli bacterium]